MSAKCVVEVLEKCENFADALKLIVSDLRQQGITQRSLPEFPKSDLLTIMGKVKRNELSVQELHIYGQWLEMLHIKLKRDKTPRRKNITFKKILKDKIGISDGYARQLRGLSKMFKSYFRFYYLSISISEFWQKRNQIEEMLTDEKIADFWKQNINGEIHNN